MKKRIFLFPTESEAEPFRRTAPEAEVRITGVGAAETAVAVSQVLREGWRELVLAGIAGSYDETLEAGAVVAVAAERSASLPESYAKSYTAGFVPKGLKAVISNTADHCGAKPEGANIENMEGAVFFALCEAAGVRFCEIRSISNRAGASRDEWQTETATENLARILSDTFIKRGIMNKTKIILWIAAAVILIALLALAVTQWNEWFVRIMTWVTVIAVSFCAGWLTGRFAGRKKSVPEQR